MNLVTPQEILNFWFGSDPDHPLQNSAAWWKKDSAFDAEIKVRFGESLRKAASGECQTWEGEALSCLALIILLDQFSRNIYRDQARAFFQDTQSLHLSLKALEKKLDQQLNVVYRSFLYLPLMHAEDQEIQKLSLEVFK
ncbi:MAG: DUF924 domain-containing protein, partial [Deltaproteobacteria bacterium]|nr:DUF924 domain-containing protein [Deltaproteobacteria bacterium]